MNTVYVIGMIAMIDFDQLGARRKRIGALIVARIGPTGPVCARDCSLPCTCADRPNQFLCMHMCRPAQDGFADSPIHTAGAFSHEHYFIETDETRFLHRAFSIVAHRLKSLCTLHKKSKSYA
jgi:hypothetical protein